jgi:hypothetical protein
MGCRGAAEGAPPPRAVTSAQGCGCVYEKVCTRKCVRERVYERVYEIRERVYEGVYERVYAGVCE